MVSTVLKIYYWNLPSTEPNSLYLNFHKPFLADALRMTLKSTPRCALIFPWYFPGIFGVHFSFPTRVLQVSSTFSLPNTVQQITKTPLLLESPLSCKVRHSNNTIPSLATCTVPIQHIPKKFTPLCYREQTDTIWHAREPVSVTSHSCNIPGLCCKSNTVLQNNTQVPSSDIKEVGAWSWPVTLMYSRDWKCMDPNFQCPHLSSWRNAKLGLSYQRSLIVEFIKVTPVGAPQIS